MSVVNTWFGRGVDQDWMDSANGFWSVLLLAVCSVGAFFMLFVIQPISCFTPAQFEDGQVAYAKHTCLMTDEFHIPMEFDIPRLGSVRQDMVHSYHLWVPLILFFQALCFKFPDIIWKTLKHYLILNLDSTVELLKQAQLAERETRQSVFKNAASVFAKHFEGNKFFLAILYLFVKLLYCVNVIGQLVFMTIYFRNILPVKAGSFISLDIDPYIKPLLSKTVHCYFQIRQIQNVHDYTVQCFLLITEIYEKLFVFLWSWIFLLAVVNIFNLFLWAGFLFLPFWRDRRISAYINAGSFNDAYAKTRFIRAFLGIDGVLVLSMISRNSSEMVAADLSQQMYQGFLEKESQYQPVPSTSAREATGASARAVVDEDPQWAL